MARSLNKVMLLGNLTRDPELKFTANNRAVCSFSIATNFSWLNKDTNEKQESVEFHNITAWGKLAEICGSLLHKGDKVYVEGRLQTSKWEGEDKIERRTTKVIIDDMILTKSVSGFSGTAGAGSATSPNSDDKASIKATSSNDDSDAEDVSDDVPF